jgi:DNA gyrase inhibitor GyrI
LARERVALEKEKDKLEAAFKTVTGWMRLLEPLMKRLTAWLNLPGLPKSIRDEGLAIMRDANKAAEGLKTDGLGM